jgi:hypothetical protein
MRLRKQAVYVNELLRGAYSETSDTGTFTENGIKVMDKK